MTSQNEFVDKVVLSLIGKLSAEDVKLVKDTLTRVSGDYEITRTCTEIIVSEYELPDCYKMYIATKTMNGEFSSNGTIKLYKDVIEKMLYTFAVPVDQITTNMLRGYFAKMQATPSTSTGKVPSNNTMNNRKCIVRSFFQWLAEEKVTDLKEALVNQFLDECKGTEEYLELSKMAGREYPGTPYAQVLKDIAREEHVHKNHIKVILRDMCVAFTDEMNKADAEAEAAFRDLFQ